MLASLKHSAIVLASSVVRAKASTPVSAATWFLGVALAAPAAAQQVATVEEAAQINGGLAVQICLAAGVDGPQTAAMFRQAGFSEQVKRSSVNSDTTHIFTAPSESARAEVYYGEMPFECRITSDHMGVTMASGVLDRVVPQIHPGFVRRVEAGPANPTTGQPAQCVTYEDPASPIGLAISALPNGGAQGCVDNGTSRFAIYFRV